VKQKNTAHPAIPDASCQPLLLVVGGHLLTGAASTIEKVNGLKLQVNTYFGKLGIKVSQKQNFYISSKTIHLPVNSTSS
jgi:hypothetical protein